MITTRNTYRSPAAIKAETLARRRRATEAARAEMHATIERAEARLAAATSDTTRARHERVIETARRGLAALPRT